MRGLNGEKTGIFKTIFIALDISVAIKISIGAGSCRECGNIVFYRCVVEMT